MTCLSLMGLNLAVMSCQTKPSASVASPAHQPLPTDAFQRIPNGVQMNSATLNVRVQFYADDIVRVLKWRPDGTPAKASLVVIQTNLPDLNIHFDENPESSR